MPSQRPQYLWARYWSARLAGPDRDPAPDPDAFAARFATRERYNADLLAAWQAWTANA